MIYITIGPKHEAFKAKIQYNCDYVISIQDVEDKEVDEVKTPPGVLPQNHIRLFFDDLSDEYPIRTSSRDNKIVRDSPPEKEHLLTIMEFFKTIPDFSRVYVHCFAGVSRSTAVSFMLFCLQCQPGEEDGCMMLTEQAAIYGGIWPNSRITRLADELLARYGKMIKAVQDWKAAEKALAGDIDAWAARFKNRSQPATQEILEFKNKAVLWDAQQESLKIDKPEELK